MEYYDFPLKSIIIFLFVMVSEEILMSLAGIWAIEVASLYGWESRGILILGTAKEYITGGGRNHYSIGTYDLSGDDVKITLDLHFYGQPLVLFGAQEKNISLVLEGKHEDGKITGTVANPDGSPLYHPLSPHQTSGPAFRSGKKIAAAAPSPE